MYYSYHIDIFFPCTYLYVSFQRSSSRVLRWVLLYINRKLFSRPIIALHKILNLLNGQFTIYKKQADAPLYSDMVLSRQYWNRRYMWHCAILKFATALLVSWYCGKVLIHHITGLSLSFMSSYCANEGFSAFQYGG